MGGRPNGTLLEKTERKLKSPLGAARITEQPRRHGSSSSRYMRDPMTQGYWPGGACRSCAAIPRKSSRSPGPFLVVSHYYTIFIIYFLRTSSARGGGDAVRHSLFSRSRAGLATVYSSFFRAGNQCAECEKQEQQPFGRTVITLQTPPVTHGPRASSVQVDSIIARVRLRSTW